jgi:excisionase family DNA binding protein
MSAKDRSTITRQTPYADLPEWLDVAEFRAYLGVSRGQAYDLIRTAAIPSRKFGKLIRIHKSAVAPESR